MLRSVLLPLPDGPSRTTISPRARSKSTPRSAHTSASPIRYVFTSARARMTTARAASSMVRPGARRLDEPPQGVEDDAGVLAQLLGASPAPGEEPLVDGLIGRLRDGDEPVDVDVRAHAPELAAALEEGALLRDRPVDDGTDPRGRAPPERPHVPREGDEVRVERPDRR